MHKRDAGTDCANEESVRKEHARQPQGVREHRQDDWDGMSDYGTNPIPRLSILEYIAIEIEEAM